MTAEAYDVFLSHNSRDKAEVRRIAAALADRGIRVFLDDDLRPGQPWQEELEKAIAGSRAVVVAIGGHGLGRWEGPEMRGALDLAAGTRLPVIPVLLPGAPGRTQLPLFLRAYNWVDLRGGVTRDGIDRLVWGITGRKPGGIAPAPAASEPRVSTSKLPATGALFVAREDELARLDAVWENPAVNVVTFVAMGGVGKSALVNRWLDRLAGDGWGGAERVLGWSFYSQGTDATGASGDAFVDEALRKFGYQGDPIPSPGEKGRMLADLVRAARTLLVLDGLEPLQHPPGTQTGRIKDPAALRAEPVIAVLTEGIGAGDETGWRKAVARLVKARLVADDGNGGLDAHPLVREYFGERLQEETPEAWRAGHERLYEHYRGTAPELPETVEAMMPLYAAIVHGCRAGQVQEAFNKVFLRRIRRGNEAFSVKKLGAFGAELTALAAFFDRPWDQPAARLSAAVQARILNDAGFGLRALGRLPEAVQPMRAGLEAGIAQKDWREAVIRADNLSELTLTLGEVASAVAAGEESVELADRSQDAFLRMGKRTTLADALHQAGRWEESAAAFREAEAMQAERQPPYPRLYSIQGYRYCDLLLGRAEPEDGSGLEGVALGSQYRQACEEVRERAGQTLEWAKQAGLSLLTIALDQLSLGRAHLGLALTSPAADFTAAEEHLDRAVDALRQAANDSYLPWGLLARAALHRLRGDASAAASDLAEAEEIAERGHMRLHEADAHLDQTRLYLGTGDADAARRHFERARELVTATGYGRREREVAYLASRLSAV